MITHTMTTTRRRHRDPRWRTGTLAISLALVAAACGAGSGADGNDAGEGGERNHLSVGFIAEPVSLDFTTNDGAAIPQALLVNVYEGLVKLDADGEIVPGLAADWELSEDRQTYTFTVRDDASFSTGEPFTAEDAKFSIERVQRDWTIGLKSGMDVVEEVTAVDATTLEVELARPSNSWLYAMTTRIGAMFSRSGVDDLAESPVGTGPYAVTDWTRGDAIELTARDDYWGEPPGADAVTLRYFTDPSAMNSAMRTGGLDVIATMQTPESLDQFSTDDGFQVIEGTTNGEVVLSFNHDSAPLDDVRVRKALSHALNRSAILDTAWAGHGTLIGSMVAPTDPWYEDLADTHPYDPDEARRLLRAASVDDDLELRLRIPNLPYAVASAQVVKSQLAAVGVTAEIDQLEFPARWLDEVFTEANYDMSIIAHVEPRDITSWGDPEFYWGYDNQRLRDLFAAADTGTEAEQVEYMRAAARLLAEDAAASWLFLMPNLMVTTADVRGLPDNMISEAFDLTTISTAAD